MRKGNPKHDQTFMFFTYWFSALSTFTETGLSFWRNFHHCLAVSALEVWIFFDNFECSQWWKSNQNGISISVILHPYWIAFMPGHMYLYQVYAWPYSICIHIGYCLCLVMFHMHSYRILFMPGHIPYAFISDTVYAWSYSICIHIGYCLCLAILFHIGYGLCLSIFHMHSYWIWLIPCHISNALISDMVYAWSYFTCIHVGYDWCLVVFPIQSCGIWFTPGYISYAFISDMVDTLPCSICIYIGYSLCLAIFHMHSYRMIWSMPNHISYALIIVGFTPGHISYAFISDMNHTWPYFSYTHITYNFCLAIYIRYCLCLALSHACIQTGYGLCLAEFHMRSYRIWLIICRISYTLISDMVDAWSYFTCIHIGYGLYQAIFHIHSYQISSMPCRIPYASILDVVYV